MFMHNGILHAHEYCVFFYFFGLNSHLFGFIYAIIHSYISIENVSCLGVHMIIWK